MRILGSVVAPLTALVAFCDPKLTGCSSIRSQVICDQLVWDKAIFLQKLAHEFQHRPLVPFQIEFGRRAAVDRKKRGVSRTETFAFLGLTFMCGKSRNLSQLRTLVLQRSCALGRSGGWRKPFCESNLRTATVAKRVSHRMSTNSAYAGELRSLMASTELASVSPLSRMTK
jgi:hypothetical protein